MGFQYRLLGKWLSALFERKYQCGCLYKNGHWQQPQGRRPRPPARYVRLRDGRLRQRQVDPHQRHPPAHTQPTFLPLAARSAAV